MKHKIFAFSVALFLLFPFAFANAASFSDVPENHKQYAAIESLKNLKIINGYQDGTFKPTKPVSRAEALKLVLVSAEKEIEETVAESGFTDVSLEAWYAPITKKGKALKIVKGYGDTGKFQPDNQVRKSEFVKMLLESFEKDVSKHKNPKTPLASDVPVEAWFSPYMSYAKTIGVISPSMNNQLQPDKKLTRGECAEIIYKLLVVEKGGEAQKLLNMAESKLVNILVNLKNNDIQTAMADAHDAVTYTEQARKLTSESLAEAAHSVARGFQELCFAYKAGIEGNGEKVKEHANLAKDFAGKAFNKDNGTQSLGKKIKQQADTLLGQVE